MIQTKNNRLLVEGKWFDLIYAYQFLRRLVTPFVKTDAYKLGIIDKEGNNLIPKSDFTTDDQRNAYTYFNVLIFNLKKLLGKLPFGKTALASFAAAVLLLREERHHGNQIRLVTDCDLMESEYHKMYKEIYDNRDRFSSMIKEFDCLLIEEKSGILEEEETSDLPTLQTQTSTVSALRKKQKKGGIIRRNTLPEDVVGDPEGIESHGEYKIFVVDNATFLAARAGKTRYDRYAKYVGNASLGENIRNYAVANPKMPVILKDEKTGSLCFLKMGSDAKKTIEKYHSRNKQ
jgi:hypothetical protein